MSSNEDPVQPKITDKLKKFLKKWAHTLTQLLLVLGYYDKCCYE